MTDLENLGRLEEDAFALTRVALAISEAREKNDDPALTQALDENLRLWVAIRTLLKQEGNTVPADVKANLLRLSKYVTQKTFELQDGISDEIIESLVNTNLQIAEGILEGEGNA